MIKSRLTAMVLFALLCAAHGGPLASTHTLRIGVTPVFLSHQISLLNEWQSYLEDHLKRPVRFVQRTTYKEITDLLLQEKIDFAWICGYPYLQHQKQLRLLAVPIYQGKPLYRSYLIVPSDDHKTESIRQLEGKIFAYSDPNSNSGYLVPQYEIFKLGQDNKQFFKRSFFTWAHEKVIQAVASGVAQGGAVDGYIWDTLSQYNPALTDKTRIANRSQEFGFPPFVARSNIAPNTFKEMQLLLLDMQQDPTGASILKRLNLDGFSIQKASLFDGIKHMKQAVTKQ